MKNKLILLLIFVFCLVSFHYSQRPQRGRIYAVSSPGPGAVVKQGAQCTIIWDKAVFGPAPVHITLWSEKTKEEELVIVDNLKRTGYQFDWEIPFAVPAGQYKIKVNTLGLNAKSGWSGVFKIQAKRPAKGVRKPRPSKELKSWTKKTFTFTPAHIQNERRFKDYSSGTWDNFTTTHPPTPGPGEALVGYRHEFWLINPKFDIWVAYNYYFRSFVYFEDLVKLQGVKILNAKLKYYANVHQAFDGRKCPPQVYHVDLPLPFAIFGDIGRHLPDPDEDLVSILQGFADLNKIAITKFCLMLKGPIEVVPLNEKYWCLMWVRKISLEVEALVPK